MYKVNIYESQFVENREPTLQDNVGSFEEVVDVFKYYGENSHYGHLINFWESKNEVSCSNDYITKCRIIPLDFDIHKPFNDSGHYLNSLKYIYTYNQVKRLLEENNLNYIMYKTKSYSNKQPNFRVVLPLKEEVMFYEFERLRDYLKHVKYNWKSLDKASLSNQLFKLPFNLEGNKVEIEYNIEGEDFDMLSGNWLFPEYFHIEDCEEDIFDSLENGESRDMSEHKSIKFYLNTPFNKTAGNGNSSTSLFTALSIAKKNNDEKTLDRIINKARSESWNKKEIEQKLKCIK